MALRLCSCEIARVRLCGRHRWVCMAGVPGAVAAAACAAAGAAWFVVHALHAQQLLGLHVAMHRAKLAVDGMLQLLLVLEVNGLFACKVQQKQVAAMQPQVSTHIIAS